VIQIVRELCHIDIMLFSVWITLSHLETTPNHGD
jgi:hypothetical protein